MMIKARFVKWCASRRAPNAWLCVAVAALAPGCMDAPEDAANAQDASPPPEIHFGPEITVVPGCVTATAGQGFVSVAMPDTTALETVTFTATADTVGLDAVVALSAGVPTSFNNLAAAVRFNPAGDLDARNNTVYAASGTYPYSTTAINFKIFADVASKQYSVFKSTDAFLANEIGRRYAFRATATSTHLDHISFEVDGASGTLTVCTVVATPSTGVTYSREGRYAVVPLASNQALISDGTTTQKLNAAGATTASLAKGGQLAVDASGNISIASAAGGVVSIDQYTSAFVSRWHATASVPSTDVIAAISVDSAGTTRIATTSGGSMTITSVSSAGVVGAPLGVSGDWAAFDNDQPVVAYADGTTLHVTRYTAAGATVWADAFTGDAQVQAMAIDPSHAVIFGGQLFTPINFGGGTLPTHTSENGPFNGFVVKLSSAGVHVFSHRTEDTLVGGIAVNATRIAVSNTLRTQFFYQDLLVYDATGATVSSTFEPGYGENGLGGTVALSSAGKIWWNVDTKYPMFPTWSFLVAGLL